MSGQGCKRLVSGKRRSCKSQRQVTLTVSVRNELPTEVPIKFAVGFVVMPFSPPLFQRMLLSPSRQKMRSVYAHYGIIYTLFNVATCPADHVTACTLTQHFSPKSHRIKLICSVPQHFYQQESSNSRSLPDCQHNHTHIHIICKFF